MVNRDTIRSVRCANIVSIFLNMAEIEFSVLSRSCLRQRLPDEEALRREVQSLVTERNVARASINWRFNTQDARVKLHRLYPFDSKYD